jgi:hypothetical protein
MWPESETRPIVAGTSSEGQFKSAILRISEVLVL